VKNLKEIFIPSTTQLSRMNDAARSLLRITGSLMIAAIVLAVWGLLLPVIASIAESTHGFAYVAFGLFAFLIWYYFSRLVWKSTESDKKAE
jgi:bacteriorhodopsin